MSALPKPGIMICEGRLEHLDDVFVMNQQLFPESWSCLALQDSLVDGANLWLAYIGDGPVNEILAGYSLTQDIADTTHILQLACKPEYQRQGIGSALCSHLIQMTRDKKLRQIYLEVRESNQAAIKLYSNLGFAFDGHRKNYYAATDHYPREDARLGTLQIE